MEADKERDKDIASEGGQQLVSHDIKLLVVEEQLWGGFSILHRRFYCSKRNSLPDSS